jgi:hypothetical protein
MQTIVVSMDINYTATRRKFVDVASDLIKRERKKSKKKV